jgi:hypothetical protein
VGAYADISERLIERGFAAIPIIPGTKRPGFLHAGQWLGLSNWQRRFNRGVPPQSERTRWAAGNAGIGVITGAASHGTVAIDIDTDDPTIMAAIRSVLPPTPIKKRGAKGETLFYCGPHIEELKSWDIDGNRVVDLIGPRRQTVLRIPTPVSLMFGWAAMRWKTSHPMNYPSLAETSSPKFRQR